MEFTFNFTAEKLARCIRKCKNSDEWFEGLHKRLPEFYIISPARVAGFVSQCQHESLDFTVLKENLNYGAKGLRTVFKKYFPNDMLAKQYERKPEMIANRVYANRMGNGPEDSGDGWLFRGRGLVQLTGRANYTQCSRDLFSDDTLVEDPDVVCNEPEYAILTACWFWHKNRLNDLCDRGDVITLSKRINGGTIGLEERIHNWNNCLHVFEEDQ